VIDCIIVKDFSRLGRNYIEVGNYLEKIFPFLGTRVIAINDDFDSKKDQYNEKMLLNSLKNIVNEYYARDISKKVTQTKRAKQKRGEFNGSVIPYGYKKDQNDGTKLILDPETADIVKKIFEWRALGKSCTAIGHYLDELLIPTPGAYRYQQGNNAFKRCAASKWKTKHIMGILRDPVYLGDMAQGKYHTSYFKNGGKMITLPKEEWQIVKGTHEAIATQEQYDVAEKMAKEAKSRHEKIMNQNKDVPKVDNPFASKIVCGQCGRLMTRRSRVVKGKRIYSYFCESTRVKVDGFCKNTTIYEEEMTEAIRLMLSTQFKIVGSVAAKLCSAQQSENTNQDQKNIDNDIKRIEDQIERLSKDKKEFYSDMKDGILTVDEYAYAKEQADHQIRALSLELNQKTEQADSEKELYAKVQDYREQMISLENADISYEMIDYFVDKIVVVDSERLEVSFRFADQLRDITEEVCGG